MPVTTGKYSNAESQIFQSLRAAGLNTAAACGVLANLYAESGFNPNNLENTYESSLGYDDSSYTKSVNNGSYTNFVKDSAGYGLAQWTYHTRKQAMYQYIVEKKKSSIGNLDAQIEFLIMELKGETPYSDFKRIWDKLLAIEDTPQGAYEAGYEFCKDFEKPQGGSTTYTYRGNNAKDIYWSHYSTNPESTSTISPDLGSEIVSIAREQLEKSYISGGNLYNNNMQGADSPGLVYYSYTEAGINIPQSSVAGYYTQYKDARRVNIKDVSAGDLLFYDTDGNIGNGFEYIAIATGEGGRIYSDPSRGIIELPDLGSPSYIVRILSDSETNQVGGIFEELTPDNYTSLSSDDPYSANLAQNLSRVESVGYDSGYLIDMTHGGEFRFYIPEFTEQAGAQWSTVEIRGRSAEVKSYESTSSRNVTVSLELYAGVGYYAPRSGETAEESVSRLHSDVYFVKSLEYPDYTNVITRPPSTVHLILGSAFNLSGVVSNVSVEHLKPLDSQNRAMYIKLSFTVTQVAVNPPDWTDIRGNQNSIISTSNIDSLNIGGINNTNAPIYSKEES